ncbi:hypothetical protein DH09_11330 [Bacillaceae bacterium JMAK1]|nr:hypothetical protein DH09_11330 [Bacillaceae bacterium JMAK1]
MKKKVILDCDPGHDDAIAIFLAAGSDAIDLLAITTVSGNARIEDTTRNALVACELAGLDDIPVAAGACEPLVGEQVISVDIHGKSGMDGPDVRPPKKQAVDQHAVDYLIDTIHREEDPITLVATGPLTNVAQAIKKDRSIVEKLDEIVIMGGGSFGNKTPAAEFNIYVDAEAAKVVFESGVKLTMVGLDLTHQALAQDREIAAIENIDGEVAAFTVELLRFFRSTYLDVFDIDGGPIHDACCIAYCINPEVFTTKHLHVDIEIKAEHTYGMTVIDYHHVLEKEPNAHVAMELNQDIFWDMLYSSLQNLNK